MAYAQARRDFEYLETICELDDWVEIDGQVLDLMRNPTKARATEMYESCIRLWFGEMRDTEFKTKRILAIKDRYWC